MKKARKPTDCDHGVVPNSCSVQFSLTLCQGCVKALMLGEATVKIVKLAPESVADEKDRRVLEVLDRVKAQKAQLEQAEQRVAGATTLVDEAVSGLIDVREALRYFQRIRAALVPPPPSQGE